MEDSKKSEKMSSILQKTRGYLENLDNYLKMRWYYSLIICHKNYIFDYWLNGWWYDEWAITPWVHPFSLPGPLPSSFRNSAPNREWPHRLSHIKHTERLNNDDLFLLRGSYPDLLHDVLHEEWGTSVILRSDWMTFLVVDQ